MDMWVTFTEKWEATTVDMAPLLVHNAWSTEKSYLKSVNSKMLVSRTRNHGHVQPASSADPYLQKNDPLIKTRQ